MLEAIKSVLKQAANARSNGQPAEAERLYREAAAEAQAKDDVARAEALMGVAQTRRDQGDRIGASINYAEAIAILRGANATPQLAHALRHAADVRSQLKEYAAAGSQIDEAIRLYSTLLLTKEASTLDLANALRVSALNSERQAHASWTEACELYDKLHITAGTAECNEHLDRLKYNDAAKTQQGDKAA